MASHVAHHFDDARQQFRAAQLGMWVFLATEVLFFGGLFTGYMEYRIAFSEAFRVGSRHLDLVLGTLNTAVLLTSSLMMALAVHAAETGQRRAQVRYLLLTIGLGAAFLAIKGYEYYHKFADGLFPGHGFQLSKVAAPGVDPHHVELFFSFYFAMTGLHALHMIVGIGVLTVLVVLSARGRFSPAYSTPLELSGLYWHFVDIVWVFLYPLLYLLH